MCKVINCIISLKGENMSLKPLTQDDFPMTIIKDLGMLYPTESSVQTDRFGMFKCNRCNEHFKLRILTAKASTGLCKNCRKKTHGMAHTKLYNVFKQMKTRCYNKSYARYDRYGERGIIICDEWLSDSQLFLDWALDNGYKDGLTIDRIDNDKGYFPENCRWTTMSVQGHNKSDEKNNSSGYRGVTLDSRHNRYVARIQINKKKIYLGRYDNPLDAHNAVSKYRKNYT